MNRILDILGDDLALWVMVGCCWIYICAHLATGGAV